MIYETIDVLQNMQKDVTSYLEKLIQIDRQFEITSAENKKDKTVPPPKPIEQKHKTIENEIDDLIGKFKEKQK